MRKLVLLPALLLIACATPPPAQREGTVTLHRHCAEELEVACDPGSAPFASCILSEECARDVLFALNQSLGGGPRGVK